jgi:Cys-rich protein (TIGR01571 family)
MVDFDENLFGCLSQVSLCCVSLIPGACCYLQAVAVDRSQEKGILSPCILSCFLLCIGASINRGQIRDRYHIDGNYLKDCLIWLICIPCAATQELREVNRREGI